MKDMHIKFGDDWECSFGDMLAERHTNRHAQLVEFMRNNKYSVNEAFRYVACADIANGMAYLHRHDPT